MIYLIGGAPRCGKTILARRLANKKRIPHVSTDSLRSVIVPYVPKSRINRLFPFEAIAGSESCTPSESLEAEIQESQTMWPGIRPFIEQLILCKEDYVIEGVHFMPGLVAEFKGTKFWKSIKYIALIKRDLDMIVQGFPKNKCEHDWMSGCFEDKELLQKMGEMVLLKSEHVGREAKKHRMRICDTSNNFNAAMRSCMKTF